MRTTRVTPTIGPSRVAPECGMAAQVKQRPVVRSVRLRGRTLGRKRQRRASGGREASMTVVARRQRPYAAGATARERQDAGAP